MAQQEAKRNRWRIGNPVKAKWGETTDSVGCSNFRQVALIVPGSHRVEGKDFNGNIEARGMIV